MEITQLLKEAATGKELWKDHTLPQRRHNTHHVPSIAHTGCAQA